MTIIKSLIKLSLAAVLAVSLAACTQDSGPKQTGGALIGAAAGGLLGSTIGSGSGRLAATAAGALLGALVGSEVGRSLDRADRLAMQRTTHTALETGRSNEPVVWNNPDTGHRGTVTPQPATGAP